MRALALTGRFLLAAVLFAFAGILMFRLALELPPAERWLRDQVTGRVNRALAGTLSVEGASLTGAFGLTLEGVRLQDPAGTDVARARAVTVQATLRSLLGRALELRSARIEGLEAHFIPDSSGRLALERALASRTPSVPGGTPRPWRIRRVDVTLEELSVRSHPEQPPSFAVSGGELTGTVSGEGDRVSFEGTGELIMSAPAKGPAHAEFEGRVVDGKLEFTRLEATLPGGIRIESVPQQERGSSLMPAVRQLAAAALGALAPLRIDVELPADGLVKYGGPALAGPLRIDTTVRLDAGRLWFDARVRPSGPGYILAEGWAETGGARRFNATVDARGIDPSRLLPQSLPGRVWAATRASGSLAFPPSADAQGTVWRGPSRLEAGRVGPGEARFSVRGARWDLRNLSLAFPDGDLEGAVTFTWPTDGAPAASFEADLHLRSTELAGLSPLLRALGIDPPPLAGPLTAWLSAAGSGPTRRVTIEGASPRLRIGGTELGDLWLLGERAGGTLHLEGSAVAEGHPLRLESAALLLAEERLELTELAVALGPLQWELARPARFSWHTERAVLSELAFSGPGTPRLFLSVPLSDASSLQTLSGRLHLQGFPLEELSALLPETPGLAGLADIALELEGTVASPRFRASLKGRNAAFGPLLLPAISAELAATHHTLALQAGLHLFPEGTATFELDLQNRERALWTRGGLRTARVKGAGRLVELPLRALAHLDFAPAGLDGVASATMRVGGVVQEPDVTMQLALREASLPHFCGEVIRRAHLDVGVTSDARETAGTLLLLVPGAPPITATGALRGSLTEVLDERRRTQLPLELHASMLAGRLDFEGLRVHANQAQALARVSGTLADPLADLRVHAEQLYAGGELVGDLVLQLNVQRTTAEADLAITQESEGLLEAHWTASAPRMEASIQAHDAKLDFLEVLPQLARVDGSRLDGSLFVTRRPGEPLTVSGELTGGAAVLRTSTLSLREVALDLSATGTAIDLRRVTAASGNGRGTLEGSVSWGERRRGQFTGTFERFPLRTQSGFLAELTTTATLDVLEADVLEAVLSLSPGELRLPASSRELHPLALPPDIHVAGTERPRSRGALPFGAGEALLRLSVPSDFWIRAGETELEVTVAPTSLARWADGRLSLTGELQVTRGRLVVLTRRFDVERLRLTFTGGPLIDPVLDGALRFERPGARIEMGLAGTLREPAITLRSEPPMDEAEIALMLASGNGTGASGLSDLALGSAFGVLSGQVRDLLVGVLPVDVLELELGPTGRAERFEAGAYVTPRLFLSFGRNLFAAPDENLNEVQADYRLSRWLSLEARYGDRQSGAFNLLWERRLHSRAQKRTGQESALSPAR